MHNVSQTYRDLYDGLHTVMTVVEIETVQNGATVYEELENDRLYSVKTSGALIPDRQDLIGNFCAREADIVLIPPTGATIPKMARIRLFVYLKNGEIESERIPKGTFYIDTRSYDKTGTKMTIHAYDAALKFQSDYADSSLSWPANAENVVQEIANSVGVALASGVLTYIRSFAERRVPLMPNLTKHEILCGIATMFCSNWIIRDDGTLDLLPLDTGAPSADVFFLADENGNRITIGGVGIDVGR